MQPRKRDGPGCGPVVTIAAFVLFAANAGDVWAKDSLAQRIAKERQELAGLQQELDRIKKQRDQVHSKERTVAERLRESERVLTIQRRALRLAELSVDHKDQEIAEALGALGGLQNRADETRRVARTRVRELAKWKGVYDGTFVVAAAPAEMTVRYDTVRRVVERDRRAVIEAQTAAVSLSEQVQTLERLRQDLEGVRREERAALKGVVAEREARRRLLSELRTERVAYSKSIRDLEEASRRLEALIGDLVRASTAPGEGVGLAMLKGRLIWPVQGEVVGGFGRQKHPRFGTYVDRKGIEIKVAKREAIRAVAEGTVAYADRVKGYGMVVIVDHGDQYLSLYANAASAQVRPGEAVGAGDRLGEASAAESEGRVYFELRHGESPLNPLGWLLKRGGTE
jgi:septal ring factor EnvC (AmiA/AmiB activator)